MTTYLPGTSATFFAEFNDDNLEPVDPDAVFVNVTGPFGSVIEDADPERLDVGKFRYVYDIAADDPIGPWYVEWFASVDGELVGVGREDFLVDTEVNDVPSLAELYSPLRSRIGELSKLPADQNGSDTLFLDVEIGEILSMHRNNLDAATLEAWERKAGRLAHLINIADSGASRELSKKFDQANKMVEHWSRKLGLAAESRSAALGGRVVARVASMREEPSAAFVIGMQPNAYSNIRRGGAYERMFLTKRLLIPIGG